MIPDIKVLSKLYVCSDPYQLNLPNSIRQSIITELGRELMTILFTESQSEVRIISVKEEKLMKEIGQYDNGKPKCRPAFQISVFFILYPKETATGTLETGSVL